MAQISVNDEFIANGKLTIKRTLIKDEMNNEEIVIEGILATHFYFEEINTIDSFRYRLEGIKVVQESFGSEDHDIIYSFIADDLIVKNGMTILSPEYLEEIEKNLYNEDGFSKNSLYGKDE